MNSTAAFPTDELLDFSALEEGKNEPTTLRLNLRELVTSVFRGLETRATAKGLTLTCDITPESPEIVYVDPLRFRQLFLHLVGFCIRSCEKGDVELQCEQLADMPDRSYLHIAVRDSGPCLSLQQERRIQQAFAQPRTALQLTNEVDRSVAISSLLVHAMDGIMWVDVIPGTGNLFHAALWVQTRAADGNVRS